MRLPVTSTVAAVIAAVALGACGGSKSSSSSGSSPAGSSSADSATSGAVAATSAAATATSPSSSTGSPNRLSYEGIPLEVGPFIAPADTTQTGPVDGIKCEPVEQVAYHIHVHLAVFVDGRLYSLPGGIGIPGSVTEQTNEGPVAAGGQCFYWLHTHTSDGVIHIESPTERIYTLGDFFDEWHQPLTNTQVGDVHGRITAFYNGKLWTRSPRAIPLVAHALIQFDIGQPTPPSMQINWAGTGL